MGQSASAQASFRCSCSGIVLLYPKAGAQHPFPPAMRMGEMAEMAVIWMRHILAQAKIGGTRQTGAPDNAQVRDTGREKREPRRMQGWGLPNPALLPPMPGESGTAQPTARWGLFLPPLWRLNSELGRFSVENFKSRSGCSVIRVSTSPISKELVWNQPSDSGKFAPILLAWAEQPSSP